MKTKTTITELNKENLIDLFSAATYGSSWFDCYANDREGLDLPPFTSREEVWAECLLAGKRITCVDYNADGQHYGELPYTFGKEDFECEYSVSLKDIIIGLQKCADGTFVDADKDETGGYILSCFNTFKEDDGGLDNPQAEALMQVIIFGELIYG